MDDRERDERREEMARRIEQLENEVKGMKERDSRRLQAGLTALGGAVLFLCGYIWWQVIQPAIDATHSTGIR